MAQVIEYVSNSDRKKPVFVVCGNCGHTAKRLHFQSRTNKYNPVDMAFCQDCKMFTNIGTNEILIRNKKGEFVKCA